jgi:hypothetical protein
MPDELPAAEYVQEARKRVKLAEPKKLDWKG